MPDLDLEAIKHRWANVDIVPDDPCADVPILIAELERVLRLLGPVDLPSVDAHENVLLALTEERAVVVEIGNRLAATEGDRDRLAALLGEVLGTFRQVGGEQMAWSSVRVETLTRWRHAVVTP